MPLLQRARSVVATATALVVLAATAVLLAPGAVAVPSPCGASTLSVTRVSAPKLYLDSGTTPKLDSAYEGYRITNTGTTSYPDVWVRSQGFGGSAKVRLNSSSPGVAHIGPMAPGAVSHAYFYLTATGPTTSAESHDIAVFAGRPDLEGAPVCTAAQSLTAEEDIQAAANKITSVVSGPKPPQLGGVVTITISGQTGTIGAGGAFVVTPASYSSWPADKYRLVSSRVQMTGGNTRDVSNSLYESGLNSSTTDYVATFEFQTVGVTTGPTTISPLAHISSGAQTKHTTTSGDYATLQATEQISAANNNITLAMSAGPTSQPSTGGTSTYTLTATNSGTTDTALDDVAVTMPTGETLVAGSARWNGGTTTPPSTSGATSTFVAAYVVPAGSSRTFTFEGSLPATPGSYTARAVAHIAATQVDTTVSTTDDAPATAAVTVLPPPPTVTAVNAATGTTTGGTSVTVTGTNFTGATSVLFGTTPATSYTVVNATTITATTPAHAAGTLDVTVTTASGTSATSSADRYTFLAPPLTVTTLALTTSAASTPFGTAVTLTATPSPGTASGTVTFTDVATSGPDAGSPVTLGTATISDGAAELTLALPAFGTNTVTATYDGDSTHATAVSNDVDVEVAAVAGTVIVNQFRLSGADGAEDSFVELYNAGPAAPLAGFEVQSASGGVVTLPSSAPTLPQYRSFLVTGADYSLHAVSHPDHSEPSLGTGGLRVRAPDTAGTVTDAVGSGGAGYFLGTALAATSGTPTDQHAWVRLEDAGRPRNSSDNAADFALVSTTGAAVGGVTATLGTPSPRGFSSPFQHNETLVSTLLDTGRTAAQLPNRVYVPDTPSGQLVVRRTITNTGPDTVEAVRVRMTSLSELNGAPLPGVTTQPSNAAQLRLVPPGEQASYVGLTNGTVATVQNLTPDWPAPSTPGGGLATTMVVPLTDGYLEPGESVDVAFSFAVDQGGYFWFGYDVEALPIPGCGAGSVLDAGATARASDVSIMC